MLYEITHKTADCQARTGILHTAHGDIETPVFMPVGTQATVKSLDSHDLENLGAQIILANTYHLHLRPGEDLIANFGGLHEFMHWNKPILTDSGGFQVFSLDKDIGRNIRKSGLSVIRKEKLVKVDDDGVTFRSHIDGSSHRFTPETSIEIQHKLGADIIMAFDQATADGVSEDEARIAMERTHRWAQHCLDYHKSSQSNIRKSGLSVIRKEKQFLFGIIQGSTFRHLREESARFIASLNFDGIAIGGESIGFNMKATKEILDWIAPLLPDSKPRYTMGLGHSPLDLFDAVERGVDMFDCVSPTRMARNGTLYIHPKLIRAIRGAVAHSGNSLPHSRNPVISITNAQFRTDQNPVDTRCTCSTCQNYSRAYLHHLFIAEELLAYRLATIHNVHFFLNLMRDMRQAIRENRFLEFKKQWTK
ncbi:MAG: tRNA guanosine(34) transglycosylase Tgt [Candidatus Magasanikbacteria bacterium RIFCSPHIGHO2_02_FULL_51_14]|uniref:Queuine tRNA-ribosyltransferase n=1 Tax=Candidatus Magasanikbacteria bacterium RIFCSPHIGHO2_02_FULL_51_14 TaxID=1798683 RepID=A0A1F6MEG2_9BACT|nr:MAG: tRNA guanosine(34) transglycosylase Tgt [Candidatus Magasanikbacteria bacterium RIFCSPHIGHO2_02_FULL_51_14]